jgi:hypothetical protein
MRVVPEGRPTHLTVSVVPSGPTPLLPRDPTPKAFGSSAAFNTGVFRILLRTKKSTTPKTRQAMLQACSQGRDFATTTGL